MEKVGTDNIYRYNDPDKFKRPRDKNKENQEKIFKPPTETINAGDKFITILTRGLQVRVTGEKADYDRDKVMPVLELKSPFKDGNTGIIVNPFDNSGQTCTVEYPGFKKYSEETQNRLIEEGVQEKPDPLYKNFSIYERNCTPEELNSAISAGNADLSEKYPSGEIMIPTPEELEKK